MLNREGEGEMLYIYLDESGDLGFDFVSKKPSSYFTVCVLAVRGNDDNRAFAKLVRAVLRRQERRRQQAGAAELKGSLVPIATKKFFYKKVRHIPFKIYAVTLDKRKIYSGGPIEKDRVYNYIARLVLEGVDFKDAAVRVIMTVDKSRNRRGIFEFNTYILKQIKAFINPLVPLDIFHVPSHESPGLQAADMFAWGVFRKYEQRDTGWYEIFRARVSSDKLYLPQKEEERADQAKRPGY